MDRFAYVLPLVAGYLSNVCVAASPEVYVDASNGFRISPPKFDANTTFGFTSQPVTFAGPPIDGGAPSCNVQIQNTGLNAARYRELSQNQFKAMGITIDSEVQKSVSGREATLWHYSGQGIKAIALAVYSGDQTFIVTCLSPEDKFKEHESTFSASIESFKLERN